MHDRPLVAVDQLTFLDLFSGAGGLSLGLKRAGWVPLLAVDHWPDAVASYRSNFDDHPALDIDIRELTGHRLVELLPNKPDWIVGGPPCQGFSTVGKRQRDDPRNSLVGEFRRLVDVLRPEGFLIENVLGLKDMQAQDEVIEAFAVLGYSVSFHVLRAADYGVPQLRRRVVFVGHRQNGFFRCPTPAVQPHDFVTVLEAIGDLPVVAPGEEAVEYEAAPFTEYQRLLRSDSDVLQGHVASKHPAHLVRAISFIPDGGNRTEIPDAYQPRSGFHNSYSRLSSRHPAVAVTSNMGKPSATRCIHPFQDRGLTAREGARLQSFPDRFWFQGGITSQRLQVANAVPPLLAEALARGLMCSEQWAEHPHEEPTQISLSMEAMQLEAA